MDTLVKDVIKPNPVFISADITLKDAAQKMKSADCGVLPVGSPEKIEGVITDRDIVIRAVANSIDITTAKVGDYMTREVLFCKDTDTLVQVAKQMHENHISRLAVKDSSGKPCGIITFGCILRKDQSLSELSKVVGQVAKKAA